MVKVTITIEENEDGDGANTRFQYQLDEPTLSEKLMGTLVLNQSRDLIECLIDREREDEQ